MPALPPLHHWDTTRQHLQRAAQITGGLHKAFTDLQPNALHLALYATAQGISTGMTRAGEFALDFTQAAASYCPVDGQPQHFPLNSHTPESLRDALLQAAGMQAEIAMPEDRSTPFTVDTAQSAEFAAALYTIYTAMARFRARLGGTMTPLVLWPHHFDLSFLWFKGNEADEHKTPHLNFGFSPYSEGFDRPYLYAYVYPMPDGLLGAPLPEPARWHSTGWTGVVIDYDALTQDSQPEQTIDRLLEGVFAVIC